MNQMKYAIDVIGNEACFEGFFKLVRYRVRHSLFAGGWSRILVRERMEALNAVAAMLYDPRRDQLVLVEQFRIGALEAGPGAWTLEPVGGVVMDGEDPASVVRREAMEEAGCQVECLEAIGSYYVSPGTSVERVRLFCGCVDASAAGGTFGVDGEGEDTRVVVVDAASAIQRLFTGGIDTALTIIGVQWLAMNRERLRQGWGA